MRNWRAAFVRWLLRGVPVQKRMYASARPSRGTVGFSTWGNSSADAELAASLTALRSRSRQMVRDNPYAKRARSLVVNNVVGGGMGLQAQVRSLDGALMERVNRDIEERWAEWCEPASCHTAGTLHFYDLERVALGEVFEAGEVLIRKHYLSLGGSRVPLALELIEAERLAGEFESGAGILSPEGVEVRMGVEVDRFQRPVAYWIRQRHPGDLRFNAAAQDRFERVPADEILHLRLVERPSQTRGVPWMHTVLTKLDAMNEYTAAEVQAARDSAFYFATVKSTADPDSPPPLANEGAGTGVGEAKQPPTYAIEPGVIQHLEPHEELEFHAPNRPNTALDAFLRYMLREVAAGLGISYAALSQDYSQSNFSSSRLSVVDERDWWRCLQQWWIRSFREPLHRLWLQQAVLARAVQTVPIERYGADPARFEAARFKARGWTWIDPVKEIESYKEAVRAGFTTITDVIAATAGGQDIEDVIATRKRELEMLTDAGVTVDTTPAAQSAAGSEPPSEPPDDSPGTESAEQEQETARQARVVSFQR